MTLSNNTNSLQSDKLLENIDEPNKILSGRQLKKER